MTRRPLGMKLSSVTILGYWQMDHWEQKHISSDSFMLLLGCIGVGIYENDKTMTHKKIWCIEKDFIAMLAI